jgi:hypothetical protein
MKTDTPFNARSYRDSLFTFSPRTIAARNRFFPGMPVEIMGFRNRPPSRPRGDFDF